MKTTANYVHCDKCHANFKDGRPKPDIESKWAFHPRIKSNKLKAILSLWNGVVYKTPLCCVWFYFKMEWMGLLPGITVEFIRNSDGGVFKDYDYMLDEKHLSYIKRKRSAK